MDDTQIRYGMGAIKGMGRFGIIEEAIIEERVKSEFCSLSDLCRRMISHKLNKRLLEIIVKSGLLDAFKIKREILLSQIEIALKIADQGRANLEQGQTDLFGLEINPDCDLNSKIDIENYIPQNWSSLEILKARKEVLGFISVGHPLDENLSTVRSICSRYFEYYFWQVSSCWFNFFISYNYSAKGKLAIIELDDKTGSIEWLLARRNLTNISIV